MQVCKIISAILATVILFLIFFSYFQYLTLKKVFVSQISSKISSVIGQRMQVRDLSFSPSAGISIHDVTIENPEGFREGRLLSVKRVSILMKYNELIKGKIAFKTIEIEAPELTLMRDKNNRLNISDALKTLLLRKSTIGYRIDTLKIHSGIFDLDKDHRYHNSDIAVTLNHLSSEPGTKTLIRAKTSYLGKSRISLDSWAYLNDNPIKFSLSVSLDDIDFSLISELIGRDRLATGKTTGNLNVHAEGDTFSGVTIKSIIHLNAERFILYKDRRNMTLTADAFLDIADDSLTIISASLYAGEVSAARLTGVIKDMTRNPSYRAQLKIDSLDLSAFNLIKGLKSGGVMTSDNISIKGKFDKKLPVLSGSLRLSNGSLEFSNVHIDRINADIRFSSSEEISAKAEASAKILRAGKSVFLTPADARLVINIRGVSGLMALSSSIDFSPLRLRTEKGKNFQLEGIHAFIEGNLKSLAFSAKSSVEFKGIRYADYAVQRCTITSALDYLTHIITLRNLEIKSEKFLISADSMRVAMPEHGEALSVETKNLYGSYPEKKGEITQLNCSASLTPAREGISGSVTLSNGKIIFQGVPSGVISAEGRFDKNVFSLDMPRTELFQGIIKLSAKGKTSGGPFPMTVAVTAENLDLLALSRAVSGFFEIPYRISGKITNASFRGTMESINSIDGSAAIRANNLAVIKAEGNKTVIKDVILNSEVAFHGKDIDFKTDANTGNLSATLSGTANGFMKGDIIRIKAAFPEAPASDIRKMFWDVFPDKLLYAGLEGSLSGDISADYRSSGLSAEGELRVKNLTLQGENREYSIGPVNGIIPVHYSGDKNTGKALSLPSFESSEYQKLSEYYEKKRMEHGLSKITIGSLRYGFRLLEDIEVWLDQRGGYLNISRFGANIFGGRLDGSAVVTLSDGLDYRAGMIVKGISLTKLCEDIEPIKGYITGKVDGIAAVKGSGAGMDGIIGMANFWTYGAGGEKTKISREFLQKIGGPSMKSYLRDRPFDKGILSLYIQKGFLIFRELDISHKNLLGVTDLSVKVAPLNNRIEIDHLMSTIAEAAERAKEK